MNIELFLRKNILHQEEERLVRLKEIGAPKVMIESVETLVEGLYNGNLPKINGDCNLLNKEFEKFEVRKGKGGKPYIHFDCGVNYFPNSKYGRFIAIDAGADR